MALLIVELDKRIGNAQAWRDTFAEQIPELPIRIWPEVNDLSDIEYLAFMHPDFNTLPAFPNLKAMFSRAAGVDDIVKHPKLPKVPLGKVEPPGGDPMMTEYVIMHVLRFHRDMPAYQAAQARREWIRVPIARPEQRRIGFLGFGMMAKAPALILKSLGFPVSAWVRSPRESAEVPIFHGARSARAVPCPDRYRGVPVAADAGDRGHLLRAHVRHDAERRHAGERRTRQARRGQGPDRRARFRATVPCGAGRAISRATATGEPAPTHPKITVMPHVARRPTVAQLVTEIVANIRSLERGGPLLQEVDLALGY